MENKEKENPFKKLETEIEIPSNLEDKVMTSIHFSKLLGNLTDLFTIKMGESFASLFKIRINSNQKDTSEDNNVT